MNNEKLTYVQSFGSSWSRVKSCIFSQLLSHYHKNFDLNFKIVLASYTTGIFFIFHEMRTLCNEDTIKRAI